MCKIIAFIKCLSTETRCGELLSQLLALSFSVLVWYFRENVLPFLTIFIISLVNITWLKK